MAVPPHRSDEPGARHEEEPGGEGEDVRRQAPRRGEGERRRGERHEGRLRDFARRILTERDRPPRDGDEEGDREGYVPLEAAREVVSSLLETGDRAKTEMVRMVAREVRNYLSELKFGDELRRLLRDYELDVHATLKLRPQAASRAQPVTEPEPAPPPDEPAP